MDGWRAGGRAGGQADGRTDGMDGWMDGWTGGRTDGRTDRPTEIDFIMGTATITVCRSYTELIRPVPEDAIAEVR